MAAWASATLGTRKPRCARYREVRSTSLCGRMSVPDHEGNACAKRSLSRTETDGTTRTLAASFRKTHLSYIRAKRARGRVELEVVPCRMRENAATVSSGMRSTSALVKGQSLRFSSMRRPKAFSPKNICSVKRHKMGTHRVSRTGGEGGGGGEGGVLHRRPGSPRLTRTQSASPCLTCSDRWCSS